MPLVWFILGILFTEIILPLLSKLRDLIATRMEQSEAKISESINESNIKMKQAVASADGPKYQIGFAIPAGDKEEEDEDEL
jgi:hypothetical protein